MIPSRAISSPVEDTGEYGSLLYAYEFEQAPSVLPPAAFIPCPDPLPPAVTLENLPVIAMQGTLANLGSPGSCEAQSFGYCLGSYTAARRPDGTEKWDAALAQNEISAAYLYNYIHSRENKQCPSGSMATPYLDRLIGHGSPSAEQIPYKPDCTYLNGLPLNPNLPGMERFRLGSFATFSIQEDPAAAILLIKQLISAGCAVAFSGPVLENYKTPTLSYGIFVTTTLRVPPAGHGQVVVGYDDNIGPPASPGALLVRNSFGRKWPGEASSPAPAGMLYWSYESFATQSLAATAYPRETGPLTGVVLTATGGPGAAVNRAYQWAPTGTYTGVWIIALLQFETPIELTQVVFTEPNTGTTITGQYGHNIGNGYVYFRRTDGNQFVAGDWGIQLSGKDLSGAAVGYTGTVSIAGAQPASPPAAAVTANTPVTDTTGQAAQISVGS